MAFKPRDFDDAFISIHITARVKGVRDESMYRIKKQNLLRHLLIRPKAKL